MIELVSILLDNCKFIKFFFSASGGKGDLPKALSDVLSKMFLKSPRPDADKEIILFANGAEVPSSYQLEQILEKFSGNRINMKFGITGEVSEDLRKTLTDGGSDDSFITKANEESFTKFVVFISPSEPLPGV